MTTVAIILGVCLATSIVANVILAERFLASMSDLTDKALIEQKERQVFVEATKQRMEAQADVLKNMRQEAGKAEEEESWILPSRMGPSVAVLQPDYGLANGPVADKNMTSEETTVGV